MMGHQSRQMAMLFVDIESLIPETHLLRKIERMVSFDFIYDLLAPYYPATGRPSVDPVSMFKMLLIGYLYGIKSERRLVEEVQLNIAYRWFCGFELDDTIPNHSTFSKTRTRKWQQSSLFQKAFYEIVKQCIDSGLIDGEAMAADGSYIPANVSRESWILERQINLGIPMSRLALDRGYETGAVHRGLELLGITGYIPAIQFSNPPEKYGFSYDPQLDAFICPEGVSLTYHRLIAANRRANICVATKSRAMPVCTVQNGRAVLTRLEFGAECWPAVAIRHFSEGISAWELQNTWP